MRVDMWTPIRIALTCLALLSGPTSSWGQAPRYLHHELLTDSEGRRLAKRDGALSLRQLRAAGHSAAPVPDPGKGPVGGAEALATTPDQAIPPSTTPPSDQPARRRSAIGTIVDTVF